MTWSHYTHQLLWVLGHHKLGAPYAFHHVQRHQRCDSQVALHTSFLVPRHQSKVGTMNGRKWGMRSCPALLRSLCFPRTPHGKIKCRFVYLCLLSGCHSWMIGTVIMTPPHAGIQVWRIGKLCHTVMYWRRSVAWMPSHWWLLDSVLTSPSGYHYGLKGTKHGPTRALVRPVYRHGVVWWCGHNRSDYNGAKIGWSQTGIKYRGLHRRNIGR